ncbi:transporter substrate-binding domain-containing protein [Arthrobacter sp. R1-13]
MKLQTTKNRPLLLSAGLAAVVLALTACGGTAASTESGASKKQVEVQGAMPEPADPKSVKEYTSVDGIKAYEPAASLVPKDLREKGVIVFGVSPTNAPTSFTGSDGKTFVGMDADISRALGKILDIQIAYKSSTFDALIPGLQAKRFDAVIADMGVTVDRLKVIDMVGYARGGYGIATKPGNPLNIGEKSMCGRKIAVTLGSIQQVTKGPAYSADCVARGEAPINLISVPNGQEMFLQVRSGQVDAAYADGPGAAWASKQNPNEMELGATIPGTILSMALPGGSELTPALVQAIKHLASSPEYKEILKKWGLDYAILDAQYLDSYKAVPTPPPAAVPTK